jgi:hypothetical protein
VNSMMPESVLTLALFPIKIEVDEHRGHHPGRLHFELDGACGPLNMLSAGSKRQRFTILSPEQN